MKIKKNDNVVILTGKDKNKQGKVLKAIPSDNKVIVEKSNMVKKHVKPTKAAPHGGIIESERPIAVCKVMLVCPHCSKATRVGNKLSGAGKYVRICKRCNEAID